MPQPFSSEAAAAGIADAGGAASASAGAVAGGEASPALPPKARKNTASLPGSSRSSSGSCSGFSGDPSTTDADCSGTESGSGGGGGTEGGRNGQRSRGSAGGGRRGGARPQPSGAGSRAPGGAAAAAAGKAGKRRSLNRHFAGSGTTGGTVDCPICASCSGVAPSMLKAHFNNTHRCRGGPSLSADQLAAARLGHCVPCSERSEHGLVYFATRLCYGCKKAADNASRRAKEDAAGPGQVLGRSGDRAAASGNAQRPRRAAQSRAPGSEAPAPPAKRVGAKGGDNASITEAAALIDQLPDNPTPAQVNEITLRFVQHESERSQQELAERAARRAGQLGAAQQQAEPTGAAEADQPPPRPGDAAAGAPDGEAAGPAEGGAVDAEPPSVAGPPSSAGLSFKLRKALELASAGFIAKAAQVLRLSVLRPLTAGAVAALRALHPAAYCPPGQYSQLLKLTPDEARAAVPRLSPADVKALVDRKAKEQIAPGPSGTTYKRLSKILSVSPSVLNKFTVILQHLADNTDVSQDLRAAVNECTGRAFAKPGSATAVRPIAMGETILKTAQLLVVRGVAPAIRKILGPHSFTFGVHGGSTTYAGAVAAAISRPGVVVLKADIKNAFNTVSRERLFTELARHAELRPLWPLVTLMYGQANNIVFEDGANPPVRISGEEGGRQGDPWFSFLHDIVYRPVLDELEAEFPGLVALNYADDPAFCAEPEVLKRCFPRFAELLAQRNNQEVRADKSHVYANATSGVDDVKALAAELGVDPERASTEGLIVGGMAVGSPAFQAEHARQRVDAALDQADLILLAKRQADDSRACNVQGCAALIRLVVLPSFAHILRGHDPRAIMEQCRRMDDEAYNYFLALCKVSLPSSGALRDLSREIFFLPLRLYGLGMPSMVLSANAAYVGQWALAANLIDRAVNVSGDKEADYLRRTNADARSLDVVAPLRPVQPDDANAFDDFGGFGGEVVLPGSYAGAPRDGDAEFRDHRGPRAPSDAVPGLREAWDAVSTAGSLAGRHFLDFLLKPEAQLQRRICMDLARRRYDELLEQASPSQRAQMIAVAGGLLRFALGAIPVRPASSIWDNDFIAVVREILFLGTRDEGAANYVPVSCRDRTCRACGALSDVPDGSARRSGLHLFSCASFQPHRTRLSAQLQQAATNARRRAGLRDPLGARFGFNRAGLRVIDMDSLGFRRKLHPDGRQVSDAAVMCDDSWQAPDGATVISDTTVKHACVGVGRLHGSLLERAYSKKSNHYRRTHDIMDADMLHLVYESLGAVHPKSARALKDWAKAAATDKEAKSTQVTRLLEELGMILLRAWGRQLNHYDFFCAPLPRRDPGDQEQGEGPGPGGLADAAAGSLAGTSPLSSSPESSPPASPRLQAGAPARSGGQSAPPSPLTPSQSPGAAEAGSGGSPAPTFSPPSSPRSPGLAPSPSWSRAAPEAAAPAAAGLGPARSFSPAPTPPLPPSGAGRSEGSALSGTGGKLSQGWSTSQPPCARGSAEVPAGGPAGALSRGLLAAGGPGPARPGAGGAQVSLSSVSLQGDGWSVSARQLSAEEAAAVARASGWAVRADSQADMAPDL